MTIPPAVGPTLLRQMDVGSLACAQIVSACRTHEHEGGGGSGTNKSAQGLTLGGVGKLPLTLPARESNPGSSD